MIRFILGVFALLWMILVGINLTSADAAECGLAPAILDISLGNLSFEPGAQDLRDLPLKVAPDDPDSPWSGAKVRLRLIQITPERWALELKFYFDRSEQLGLPYTLQKGVFLWRGPDGLNQTSVDWSRECTDPGRSIFPGETFTSNVFLLGHLHESIQGASFRLW